MKPEVFLTPPLARATVPLTPSWMTKSSDGSVGFICVPRVRPVKVSPAFLKAGLTSWMVPPATKKDKCLQRHARVKTGSQCSLTAQQAASRVRLRQR